MSEHVFCRKFLSFVVVTIAALKFGESYFTLLHHNDML